MKFKTICAYCGRLISIKDLPDEQPRPFRTQMASEMVSHGICKSCLASVRAEYGLTHKGEQENDGFHRH